MLAALLLNIPGGSAGAARGLNRFIYVRRLRMGSVKASRR